MEYRARPRARHARNLDRFLRARLGQLTFGLSPAGLLLVYVDWLSHVSLSPGKQYDLARKVFRKALRFVPYAARSSIRSNTPPAIEPLPQDERFNNPAWHAGHSICTISPFYLRSSGCTTPPVVCEAWLRMMNKS